MMKNIARDIVVFEIGKTLAGYPFVLALADDRTFWRGDFNDQGKLYWTQLIQLPPRQVEVPDPVPPPPDIGGISGTSGWPFKKG